MVASHPDVLVLCPSVPGSTPFAYNPLTMTMRFPAGVVSSVPSPSSGSSMQPGPQGQNLGQNQGQQGQGAQGRAWDEEPKPLLCSQYETLSDSE